MLDEAIKTASVEPDHNWQLIDLTAVLSTRAHLLSERAVWEAPEPAAATLKLARDVYQRLSVAPFIGVTRSLALAPSPPFQGGEGSLFSLSAGGAERVGVRWGFFDPARS